MKRKSRFFAGFIAAALTFGTLMATLGPQRFMHHRKHYCASQCDSNVKENVGNAKGAKIENPTTLKQ